MDAFHASAGRRASPASSGEPVAAGNRAAAASSTAPSDEARRSGVRHATPSIAAKRRRPQPIFARPRSDVHRSISPRIRAVPAEVAPLVEPPSLDEARLDVAEAPKAIPSATEISEEVRGGSAPRPGRPRRRAPPATSSRPRRRPTSGRDGPPRLRRPRFPVAGRRDRG
ncbi:Y-family DNA polymerase [Paludisphaera soli]|uniref:Y-family DNA polymerase n=1 Tax=Paludisphaera soli TaxID=2712865 RepID=UPI0036F22F63